MVWNTQRFYRIDNVSVRTYVTFCDLFFNKFMQRWQMSNIRGIQIELSSVDSFFFGISSGTVKTKLNRIADFLWSFYFSYGDKYFHLPDLNSIF